MPMVGEVLLNQSIRIVDDSHSRNGEQSQMGPHQQGLGVCVADTADSAVTGELVQICLKFGTERGIFNTVNLSLIAALSVVHHHARSPVSQMGVVVHAEKHIQNHVPVCNGSKKATHNVPPLQVCHQAKNSLERVMGSMY